MQKQEQLNPQADPPGCMYEQEGTCYKVGAHGKTYRWHLGEWVRSSCVLERLPYGGWVLKRPRAVKRVWSTQLERFVVEPPRKKS